MITAKVVIAYTGGLTEEIGVYMDIGDISFDGEDWEGNRLNFHETGEIKEIRIIPVKVEGEPAPLTRGLYIKI